ELNRKPTKGAPCYVEVNLEKKILLVANYGNGSIIAYKLDEDGAIGEQLDYIAFPETKDNQVSRIRSEEHTSELQSRFDIVCRLLLEKKNYRDGCVVHSCA